MSSFACCCAHCWDIPSGKETVVVPFTACNSRLFYLQAAAVDAFLMANDLGSPNTTGKLYIEVLGYYETAYDLMVISVLSE